ncbi:hypothetical protein [Cyclobacterium sp. SYSU L10401]|uniref:hypothetical protein n=1 Tax=Cyclobacterium sp. SYSU L10401 TaxID=2678657 RepID=UPI001F08FD00|nr:hypothetical protein [Cyclobacterium sp. SYSU L10401]
MRKTLERRAPRSEYTSPRQLSLSWFETPFYNLLDPNNRCVFLCTQIPGDNLVSLFYRHNPAKQSSRPALNLRVLIGSLIIKHILNLDDWQAVAQITENM